MEVHDPDSGRFSVCWERGGWPASWVLSSWLFTVFSCSGRIPWWLSGKESACQCRRHRSHPWSGKIPWRREWQPTPVFLPWRIPMDRGAWRATVHGVAELDTTMRVVEEGKDFLWSLVEHHWPHLQGSASLQALPPNTVTLGVWFQQVKFWGS